MDYSKLFDDIDKKIAPPPQPPSPVEVLKKLKPKRKIPQGVCPDCMRGLMIRDLVDGNMVDFCSNCGLVLSGPKIEDMADKLIASLKGE